MIRLILFFLPFFDLIKCGLFIWLFHSKTRGAEIIYLKAIRPVLMKFEGKIEKVSKMVEQVSDSAVEETKKLIEGGKKLLDQQS